MKMLILHSPSVDEGKGLVNRVCNTRHIEEAETSSTDISFLSHVTQRAQQKHAGLAAREAAELGTAACCCSDRLHTIASAVQEELHRSPYTIPCYLSTYREQETRNRNAC